MDSTSTPVPEPVPVAGPLGRSAGAVALPEELQIEVTAACNLRCRMCLVRYRPPVDRGEGSLPVTRFKAIIDGLPRLRKVTLQGLGEPLLAPGLVEMVQLASSRGAAVGFNTNGTVLTARKAAALIDAGLNWLHVSLDGATAATYEAIRDGASFDRVVRNVRRLMALRRERGVARPHVQLVFVAMRRNVAELPDLVRLAADIGVDGVRVQNLAHDFSDADPAGRYGAIREFTASEALWRPAPDGETGAEDAADTDVGADASAAASSSAGPGEPLPGELDGIFEDARRLAGDLGIDLRLPDVTEAIDQAPPPLGPGRGCDWPWRAPYVTAAGKVQPCCMVMGSDRATLGDLAVEPLPAVWRGRAYQRFRQQLASDRPPEVCVGCALYRGTF